MTNMQRLVVVLAFIFAVLVGILLATTVFSGKGASSPTAAPSASPAASGGPSTAPSGAAPSASAGASPSASASPAPSASPTPPAVITFQQLALDAATNTAGATRTITFTAQTGTVTVKLATASGGKSKVCLFADGTQLGCRTATSGTLTGRTTKRTAAYTVTLRGSGSATPVVNVTISFPAQKPRVTITHAWFDGTSSPKTNGLQVITTPRAKGTYAISASWGGHPFLYEVDLIEQGGPGLKQVKATTAATRVTQSFPVTTPHGWMIVLTNTESGMGPTPLAATFTWP